MRDAIIAESQFQANGSQQAARLTGCVTIEFIFGCLAHEAEIKRCRAHTKEQVKELFASGK